MKIKNNKNSADKELKDTKMKFYSNIGKDL